MLFHPQDAEDATQEILVKVVTRLSSFEGRSSFRTWLYRIVANHLLNVKRGREEIKITSFSAYGDALDNTPDLDPPDPNGVSPDGNLLVTEAMLACTSGMLLCLDREQCLAYILGAILGVSDTVAAEVLELTSENFRQRLARSRRDLRNFMNDKCGLVNPANPCRCAKKTRGFIQAGHVDPEHLLFVRERICEVREAASKTYETIKTLDDKCAEIYRRHPYYQPPDLRQMLRQTEGELKSIVFISEDKDKDSIVIGDALQAGTQIHIFGSNRSESNLQGVTINHTTVREMNKIHTACTKFIGH